MDSSTHHYTHSQTWKFVIASMIMIVLLLLNGVILSTHPTLSASPLSVNSLMSFLLATAALGMAIGANVAAYLNPTSTPAMRLASPILFGVVLAVVIPYFITLGESVLR